MNQSFTEFKADKKALEGEIVRLCNDFSQKFGTKVTGISIENHTFIISEPCEKIFSVNVDVEI